MPRTIWPAIIVTTTISSAFSRSGIDISAPILISALPNSHFCSSVKPSIASSGLKQLAIAFAKAAGLSRTSYAEATSA